MTPFGLDTITLRIRLVSTTGFDPAVCCTTIYYQLYKCLSIFLIDPFHTAYVLFWLDGALLIISLDVLFTSMWYNRLVFPICSYVFLTSSRFTCFAFLSSFSALCSIAKPKGYNFSL